MTEAPKLKKNWILVALMLTMMLAAMDVTIVSTVIPQIVGDLGGFKKFSWVFSAYLLVQTASIPLYGKLADLYGRKLILVTGISIFLLGSAASAASWNIDALIVFRALQGLGAGAIMATVNTIAGDIYTIEERAKIQGWLSSIWGMSAITGPALGGAIVEYVSWHWIFLINIPIGIITIILLLIFLKENVSVQKRNIDYAGAILIFATLSTLILFLLNGGQAWPWFSFESISLFFIVFALAYVTYKVEQKAISPIMPLFLWTNKAFLTSNLAMMGMGIMIMGPQTYLPTFTQASLGLGVVMSGLVLASMSVGWPTASALSGKIYLKIGFRNTALIGIIFVFISCIGFLFIPWPQPTYLLVINQVVLGAGFGLISTPVLVGVQNMVDWDRRGVVTGATLFGRNLGQSIGAAMFGAIFNTSMNININTSSLPIPKDTDNIIDTLQSPILSDQVRVFLQQSINFAYTHIYYGMLLIAILTFWALYKMPKILDKLQWKGN